MEPPGDSFVAIADSTSPQTRARVADGGDVAAEGDVGRPRAGDPRYTVGTLTYTKAGLIAMFVWMMWGILVWTLMEAVFPQSMPLQLRRLNVPKAWIAVLMGTFTQVINVTLMPIISFQSDRTRTRWGRRIPYIAATMPLLCICLAALGFSDDIGRWLGHSAWPARLHLSPVAAITLVMGVLILLYNCSNAFVNTVYWYLFADVVPPALLGRFTAALRMVGVGASAVFYYKIYGRIETNTRQIYVGAAILYLLGMSLVCWRVREGRYPPVTDVPRQEPPLRRFIAAIRVYFRECFSHPLYISFYISRAMWALSTACTFAFIFFYRDYLGFSLDSMGKFASALAIAGVVIALPVGWIVDRMHPIRAVMLAVVCIIPLNFATFYMHSFMFFMVISALRMPFGQLFDAAEIPLMVQIMPKKQFGQFCSANEMVRSFTMIFGTIAGGLFIGYMNRVYGNRGNAYAWLWTCWFQVLSLVGMIVVYLYWLHYGGEKFNFDVEAET